MPEKYIISSIRIRRPRLRVIYPRSYSKIDKDQTPMQAFRLQILGSFYKLSVLEDGKGRWSPTRNPGDTASRAVSSELTDYLSTLAGCRGEEGRRLSGTPLPAPLPAQLLRL